MPRGEGPLGPGPETLTRFAGGLRALRSAAGGPTYRVLSERAHYSAAALSEAAGGRKLPSLAVTLAFVGGCGGDAHEWEARWRDTAAELAAADEPDEPAPCPEQDAPYVGLRPLRQDDAHRFHGRERVVDELVDHVRGKRFVGLFGPSGSGKSSVLRAGLAPALTSRVVVFTPGRRPVEECAVHLASVLGVPAATLRTELPGSADRLHLRVRQALVDEPDEAELVLVVDQFEELFTVCEDPAQRDWFIDALVAAATADTSRTRVVLGVRADFLGHCARHPGLVAALRGAQVLLGPMTAEELRQAITRPAESVGCRVEAALVTTLVADAIGRPGSLPLVAHALRETWRRRKGTTLTAAGYEAAGGIRHAIARSAEQVYTGLDPGGRAVARQIFLRLTAPGEDAEDTKRRVVRDELDEDATPVLDRLAAARLVTLDHEGVEITHEAIVRHWPRLRGWLAEDREGHRAHRDLTEAAQTWAALDEDPGALYRGTRLALAREWSATARSLSGRERRFLAASVAAWEAEHAAARLRSRQTRRLVALLGALLLIAAGALAFAVDARKSSADERLTLAARRAVETAATLRGSDPVLAGQIALAAYRLRPGPETLSALISASAVPRARVLPGVGRAYRLSFAPDGKSLLTVDGEGARLWHLDGETMPRLVDTLRRGVDPELGADHREIRAFPGLDTAQAWGLLDATARPDGDHDLSAQAVSPDGRFVAQVSPYIGVTVAELAPPRRTWPLIGPDPAVSGKPRHSPLAAFSQDGTVLAATGPDGKVRLWTMTDAGPRLAGTVPDPTGATKSLAFRPDGHALAVGVGEGVLRLIDITDLAHPADLGTIGGFTSAVRATAYSPDGLTLATGGCDGTVRLWNVTDPRHPGEVGVLTGHTAPVRGIAFSPDGLVIATTAEDRTTRLTDIAPELMAGHVGAVTATAFTPDGGQLVTAATDGMVRTWDVSDRTAPRRLGGRQTADVIGSVTTTARGDLAAAAALDGTANLWHPLRDGSFEELAQIPAEGDPGAIALAPDGKVLYAANRLWDITDPRTPRKMLGWRITAGSAAFSPDGRLLVTAEPNLGVDGAVRIWDITDLHEVRVAGYLPVRTATLAFDRHGVLATTAPNTTTRLWGLGDPAHPEALSEIPVSFDQASEWGEQLAFSPVTDTLALIAGGGRPPQLWDTGDPRAPRLRAELVSARSSSHAITFSPDGTVVATTGDNNTATLWDIDPGRLAARVCGAGGPGLTVEQWRSYFPDADFQPPCG